MKVICFWNFQQQLGGQAQPKHPLLQQPQKPLIPELGNINLPPSFMSMQLNYISPTPKPCHLCSPDVETEREPPFSDTQKNIMTPKKFSISYRGKRKSKYATQCRRCVAYSHTSSYYTKDHPLLIILANKRIISPLLPLKRYTFHHLLELPQKLIQNPNYPLPQPTLPEPILRFMARIKHYPSRQGFHGDFLKILT